MRTGAIEPVTALTTAVSGITDTSPAVSVASRSGRLAYTAYIDGNYAIYALDAAATARPVTLLDVNGAVLPPQRRKPSTLAGVLETPSGRLVQATTFPREDYKADISLQDVGAAALTGVGADDFGTFLGGGVSFLFGDTLNYHQLATTIEASGGLADMAAQVTYLNQTSRWNWGAAVQRIPYRTGAFSTGATQIGGRQVIVEQTEIFRQIDYQATGLAHYPLSRESRFEFSAGLQHIGFDHEVRTSLFSPTTGQLLEDRTEELDALAGLNVGRATAAYAFDSAYFGGTSPVRGTRARLEVTPVIGTLRFTEAVLDYRRYFMPVRPLTIAARAMHVGRYGSDGETNRLPPLFVGYPNLVRGYDTDSFRTRECQTDGRVNCPQFDRLLGSRLLVANVEVRVPVPGVFTGAFEYMPALPIEAFAFADTGVAWTSADGPSFLDGPRDFVTSVGIGARVNVLGYVVTEFNAVRPLDRPDNSWRFVFNVRPGF